MVGQVDTDINSYINSFSYTSFKKNLREYYCLEPQPTKTVLENDFRNLILI